MGLEDQYMSTYRSARKPNPRAPTRTPAKKSILAMEGSNLSSHTKFACNKTDNTAWFLIITKNKIRRTETALIPSCVSIGVS